MRMYDIINRKKHGEALTDEEIRFFVEGFTSSEIPDYQASALLMAICFAGMDAQETAALTMAMAESGDVKEPFDQIIKTRSKLVDKHSTGGVGDKTTLAVAPIVAACGVPVAKMSGRGLGHTGGTVDKLEAIAGFRMDFSREEFMELVKKHGICIAKQSANLAPADKKLYALRDVTATVDSIPLIAASIMSKKIAAGADSILLDVKMGSGAFMKDLQSAKLLAQTMVDIGADCGRKTAALITNMDSPMGYTIGNMLEVDEVMQFLWGKLEYSPLTCDFIEVTKELSAAMLFLAEKGDMENCRKHVDKAISSGAALAKMEEMFKAQGARDEFFLDESCEEPLFAPASGYISHMNAEGVGTAAVLLGAGRKLPQDSIDYAAGIILRAKTGMYVREGDEIACLRAANSSLFPSATKKFFDSITFSTHKPENLPLIYERVGF
jgi:pyrimidine-nucleoside phosphorylase